MNKTLLIILAVSVIGNLAFVWESDSLHGRVRELSQRSLLLQIDREV